MQTVLMKFCICIDIDKIYKGLSNKICQRARLCRDPNSQKDKLVLSFEPCGMFRRNLAYILILSKSSLRVAKCHFSLVKALLADVKILEKIFNHDVE